MSLMGWILCTGCRDASTMTGRNGRGNPGMEEKEGTGVLPAPSGKDRARLTPGGCDQPPLISIFRALASAAFGSRTLSTPWVKSASTFSTSIVWGIEKLRVNRLQLRSRRW